LIGKILSSPGEAIKFLFHLPKLFLLINRLMADKRVSIFTKAIPLLAIVYIIFPLDLIKELFFGPFGYIDDVIVTYYLLKTFIKMCPREVVEEHVQNLSKPRPKAKAKDPSPPPSKG
jgi:uncharacterized membrane protein YkvA (DUF1232 family)